MKTKVRDIDCSSGQGKAPELEAKPPSDGFLIPVLSAFQLFVTPTPKDMRGKKKAKQ